MKTRKKSITEESSDKKLSYLIEKLNAEIKVMQELNSSLTEINPDQTDQSNHKTKKSIANLKPKKK